MNYHGRMMNVPINGKSPDTYIHGHRDARHACAEIALQADTEIDQLKLALADAIRRPLGVVPASADGLLSHADLEAAEARRAAKAEEQRREELRLEQNLLNHW